MQGLTISTFLEPFFPSSDEPIHLFGLDAKNCPDELRQQKTAQIQVTRRQLASDKTLQMQLRRINETRGVYFVVNSGGTKAAQITRINAAFAEIDDRPLIEQHDIFDMCAVPPSIRVETLRSVHAYWLMADDCPVEEFTQVQRGLINALKSDPAINNANRLMRLPFFNHITFDEGEYLTKRITVHTFNAAMRFTPDEMKENFPLPKSETPPYEKSAYPENTQEAVMQELRWRIMSHTTYRKCGEWGNMQGLCHNGKSKSALGVNLRTGRVHCFGGCEYKQILMSFGLEFPEKKIQTPKPTPQFVPRAPQQSRTYQWLKSEFGSSKESQNE